MDCFQIIQGSFARRDIFAEGSILGSTYLFGYFRIAILLTQMLALQEFKTAARSTRRAKSERESQKMLRRSIGAGENLARFIDDISMPRWPVPTRIGGARDREPER